MGEPDRGGVVQNGAHDGLVCGHQGFSREAPARHSEGFHYVEGPQGTLDTFDGVRAESEVYA